MGYSKEYLVMIGKSPNLADFSYEDMFEDLPPNSYKAHHCEGFGNFALIKTKNNLSLLAFHIQNPDGISMMYTHPLKDFMTKKPNECLFGDPIDLATVLDKLNLI